MMNLAVETDATGRVQSVDDMELPQWAASVHRRCMQPRDACLKRGEVPGGRQPNASHVVLEIDIIGLDPIYSCFKDLEISFRCFDVDRLKSNTFRQGDMVKLDCTQAADTTKK